MRGRVCVVTGANRGIGRAAALGLARRGASVVMLARDAERGARAREEVARESGNADVSLVVCDLGSLASVRNAAGEIAARWSAVHVLVNNAGVNLARRALSVDGYEVTLAVNYLGPFLLTNLLLPLLEAGAPSRVVNVTSAFERLGRIRWDDLQSSRRYFGVRAYAQSKLAMTMFTYELAERLAGHGVTVNCVHPGLVATDLMRDLPRWMRRVYEPFLKTPEAGARGLVWLASAKEVEDVSGRYFVETQERRSSRRSYDAERRGRLWGVSEELTAAREAAGDAGRERGESRGA
jgi:NAD(P)-dependent dehydrogenase (short-subunit alcohol dehydrogenase family)